MIRNGVIIGATLLCSSTAFALDLEREELLNLYHGVEGGHQHISQEWVNLSTGIAAQYQGNEQEQIKFAPIPEVQTKIGVFTSDSLNEPLLKNSNSEYKFERPTQFGQNDNESYGVYIKQTF